MRNRISNRKNKSRKKIIIAVALLLIGIGAGGYIYASQKDESAPKVSQQPVNAAPKQEKKSTIRIIATGDMLPHDTVNQAAKTSSGYDYLPMFTHVEKYLKDRDISFCNQESPSAKSLGVSGYPTFNAPPAFAQNLNQLGCNVINLANNHSNDKGSTGIKETRDVWDGLDTLAVSGTARSAAEQNKISVFENNGIKFAFLSYTKCSNDNNFSSYELNTLNKSLTDKQLQAARDQADVILVGAHWCRENTSKQDSDQEQWMQYFANQGATAVIGTGPHWLQPVKKYKGSNGNEMVAWFSLGNFLSTQEELNGLIGGIAAMDLDIQTKKITSLSFLPTYMHYEWTQSEKAAGNLLARKNLALYPLDQAAVPLSKSLNNTTVEAETKKVQDLLNTYTEVTILKSE